MSSSKKTPEKSPEKIIEVSSVSFPVNARLVLKKIFIPFLFLLAIYVFLWKNFLLDWRYLIGVLIITLIIAIFNVFYLKVLYYKLEDDYILIKRHALNPKEVVIEYNRIKDIVIHRDILDRLFGLYQIRFETTLTSPGAHKMAYIEGLDQVEAHELKIVVDHLIEQALKTKKETK